ncbi:MAG: helix-hairpin-helix domain-containing protein, partial [Bacteroidales bacterium]|nr:helix-hairpin-helix domain-containing protein [Bacteroidales bacterium]
MKTIYWIIGLMCCTMPCFCQEKWEEYLLQLAENTDGEQDLNNLYDELAFLSQHPVDLNNATREELERLPFLSSTQIDNILTYIAKNGKMQRIYELRLVPELSMDDIELLLPFVYVSAEDAGTEKKPPVSMSRKNMKKYGNHNLLVRWDNSLNDKEGFAPVDAEELAKNPNKRYLGESFYHSVRYDFQHSNRIRAGFTAEKDSGEPFFTKAHSGYDAYSGYFLLHNVWKIRTLAAGDYRVSIGQGLILNTEFSMGKSSQTLNINNKRNADIKPHSSMDEFNYFRGAGGKISFGKLYLMLFYSNKPLDATVDSMTNSMTTIKKDGLHRTENDWKKKNVACLQTIGGSIGWSGEKFFGGLNLVQCNFDKPLRPDDKPYNRFYFRGAEQLNISLDYQYSLPKVLLFGEIAMSGNKAFAAVAGVTANPASYCRMSLLYRYYDKSYQTLLGNAFSESSGVQNEKGVYMGIEFQPVGKWRVNAYADFFRFPWLRYGVDAPSGGFDGLLQLTYTTSRRANMSLRYR